MKKRTRMILIALICLNLAFIWGNSMLDREHSSEMSDIVVELVKKVIGKTQQSVQQPSEGGIDLSNLVRKGAHISEFFTLALLLGLFIDKSGVQRLIYLAFAGMSAALIDETIQLFTGRGSQVSDVWIDLSGFALGTIIATIIVVSSRRHEKTR